VDDDDCDADTDDADDEHDGDDGGGGADVDEVLSNIEKYLLSGQVPEQYGQGGGREAWAAWHRHLDRRRSEGICEVSVGELHEWNQQECCG